VRAHEHRRPGAVRAGAVIIAPERGEGEPSGSCAGRAGPTADSGRPPTSCSVTRSSRGTPPPGRPTRRAAGRPASIPRSSCATAPVPARPARRLNDATPPARPRRGLTGASLSRLEHEHVIVEPVLVMACRKRSSRSPACHTHSERLCAPGVGAPRAAPRVSASGGQPGVISWSSRDAGRRSAGWRRRDGGRRRRCHALERAQSGRDAPRARLRDHHVAVGVRVARRYGRDGDAVVSVCSHHASPGPRRDPSEFAQRRRRDARGT
jgi:hypothetical protein